MMYVFVCVEICVITSTAWRLELTMFTDQSLSAKEKSEEVGAEEKRSRFFRPFWGKSRRFS